MKKLDKHLDDGFEIIMRGMEVIGNIVGDPPNEKKDNPKTDHPSKFAESLQLNEEGKAKR